MAFFEVCSAGPWRPTMRVAAVVHCGILHTPNGVITHHHGWTSLSQAGRPRVCRRDPANFAPSAATLRELGTESGALHLSGTMLRASVLQASCRFRNSCSAVRASFSLSRVNAVNDGHLHGAMVNAPSINRHVAFRMPRPVKTRTIHRVDIPSSVDYITTVFRRAVVPPSDRTSSLVCSALA